MKAILLLAVSFFLFVATPIYVSGQDSIGKGNQDLFFSVYFANNFNARGEQLNPKGQHPYGVFVTKIVQIKNMQYFVALNMGGDNTYSVGGVICVRDSVGHKWDSVPGMIPTKTTLLALSLGISVPYSASKHFYGPVLGINTGVAFVDRKDQAYSQALPIFGLYSQVNLGFSTSSFAGRVFVRCLYNALFSKGINFNASLEFGIAIGFGKKIIILGGDGSE